MSDNKMKATVRVTIEVKFTDDEKASHVDQALRAAKPVLGTLADGQVEVLGIERLEYEEAKS